MKQTWNMMIAIVLIYVATFLPYQQAFNIVTAHDEFTEIFLNCVFGIDMILTFFTAYYDRGSMVVDPKLIFMNYITGKRVST